ncbi:MAG: RyR domain-containing protein [bacterium]
MSRQDHRAKSKAISQQVEAFAKVRPVYDIFVEILQAVLQRAVEDIGIDALIQFRVKNKAAFAEKAIRKWDDYPDPINQMFDICGARIITNTIDEIEPACEVVRRAFVIDEAASEDVLERLGTGEFGYRSVHFILSLRPGDHQDILDELAAKRGGPRSKARAAYLELRDRLYGIRSRGECEGTVLKPGPVFKAEIQVRSLLQHAWANFSHDMLYKSDFPVPRLLQRDGNRVSAMLEEADNAFARTVRGMREYRTYFGAYMTPEQRRDELRFLQEVYRFDRENRRLAHRIARLAISLEAWDTAETTLAPFVSEWEAATFQTTDSDEELLVAEAVRSAWSMLDRQYRHHADNTSGELALAHQQLLQHADPGLACILSDYGRSVFTRARAVTNRDDQTRGREYLELAVALDRTCADHCVALAETFEGEQERRAMDWYEKAYDLNPSDPRTLNGFLRHKILTGGSLEFLSLVRPSLEQAIKVCRDRARNGVYLPHAHFDHGLFALLLDRVFDSLTAFARAMVICDAEAELQRCLDQIETLTGAIKTPWPSAQLVVKFLAAARVAKCWQAFHAAGGSDKAQNQELERLIQDLARFRSEQRPAISADSPLVIVAGGCDQKVEERLQAYRDLFAVTFSDWSGTIFSGGTTAGISGLVGDLVASPGHQLRRVGYLPQQTPAWTEQHEAYAADVYYTAGVGFSALEPVQSWVDLLADGIDPTRVTLLGLNGGEIAALEYRLALAFGARVGFIRDSGRAANDILADPDWNGINGAPLPDETLPRPFPILLPEDPQTVKLFLQGIPESTTMDAETIEELAREAHEEYRREQGKPIIHQNPALSDWKVLPDDLKRSNRNQICHIEEKLRQVGLRLEKVPAGEDIPLFEFAESDLMFLAELEHARWNVERLLSGWRLADRKDFAKKLSPCLVSWTKLTDEIKYWDIQAVKNIPKLMQSKGYRIVPS